MVLHNVADVLDHWVGIVTLLKVLKKPVDKKRENINTCSTPMAGVPE